MGKHRSFSEWEELVRNYYASGLTQQQFCRMEQINHRTFVKWLRGEGSVKQTYGFKELKPVAAPKPKEGYILRLGKGVSLELPEQMEIRELAMLLNCLD